MFNVRELQEQRGSLVEKANAIVAAAKGLLSEDELAKVTAIEAEIATVDKNLGVAQRMQDLKGASAKAIGDEVERKQRTLEKGQHVGAIITAFAQTKSARGAMERLDRDGLSQVSKALNATGAGADGEILIPEDYASEFIPLLYNGVSLLAAPTRRIELPNGVKTIAGLASSATASYVGESADIVATQGTVREITMTARKLAAMVPISNDLLRRSTVHSAAQIVQQDLLNVMRVRMDAQLLRGTGSATAPGGLYSRIGAGQRITANATVNLANVDADLKAAMNLLNNANIPEEGRVWIMSARSKMFLRKLRTSDGNRAFPEVNDSNTLEGYPIIVSNQIPNNLGGATNQSEIYLVAAPHVLLGIAMELQVATSDTASYVEASVLKSAFSQDQTVIRVIHEHDLQVRYTTCAACIEAAVWI